MNYSDKITLYSKDNEDFPFNSLDDLFDELSSEGELEVGRKYYSVVATDILPEDYICVDSILERIDEEIYEDTGECYDNDFSNTSREAKDALKILIVGWANKHVALNYWKFDNKNIKEHVITEDDIVGWD